MTGYRTAACAIAAMIFADRRFSAPSRPRSICNSMVRWAAGLAGRLTSATSISAAGSKFGCRLPFKDRNRRSHD